MARGYETLSHPIAPVYDSHSRVLMLGSFPSPKSREVGFFYGHPQNRMWRVLAAVFGEDDIPQTTEDRVAFLHRNHIAMWDVLASCSIVGASDASIKDPVPTDLAPIIAASSIERVFATGATAAKLYKRFQEPICGIPCTRLPSTSAANAAFHLDRLIEAYRIVAEAARS